MNQDNGKWIMVEFSGTRKSILKEKLPETH